MPTTKPIKRDVSPDIDQLARQVIKELEDLYPGVPYYRPRHVAPLLGITDNGFTRYCRRCHRLRLWRGSYKFFADDPEHIELLRHVIKMVIWTGTRLPAHLKIHYR